MAWSALRASRLSRLLTIPGIVMGNASGVTLVEHQPQRLNGTL